MRRVQRFTNRRRYFCEAFGIWADIVGLFVQSAATGLHGKIVVDQHGVAFRYLADSRRRYFSILVLILARGAHYSNVGRGAFLLLDGPCSATYVFGLVCLEGAQQLSDK